MDGLAPTKDGLASTRDGFDFHGIKKLPWALR